MTTELALGDIEKYRTALERALLAFHTAKMGDINAVIKELWQKTYRGQDIDYVQVNGVVVGLLLGAAGGRQCCVDAAAPRLQRNSTPTPTAAHTKTKKTKKQQT